MKQVFTEGMDINWHIKLWERSGDCLWHDDTCSVFVVNPIHYKWRGCQELTSGSGRELDHGGVKRRWRAGR